MKSQGNFTVSERKLLEDYQVGDFFLASPTGALLAKGFLAGVSGGNGDGLECLAERVASVLEDIKGYGCSNPVIVGAIPFDYTKNVRLIVPKTVQSTTSMQFDPICPAKPADVSTYEITSVPEPAQYEEGVEKGLGYIESGLLNKIVLSRSLHIISSTMVDIHQLLYNLARRNTHSYTFAVDLSKDEFYESGSSDSFSTGRTLIGASPELLVSRSGLCLTANPLAGSRPRSKDPDEDLRMAKELLSSSKDLYEHEIVVNAVVDALRPFCKRLEVPERPSLIDTGTMWHLSTEIKGELANSSTSSLRVALALHPTPAVCGFPTELAREAIREIEPFDREFFTGIVGWCDANGDGEWVVAIRCAEIKSHSLHLYAGAGVVAGSKPDEELAETAAKFRTMFDAMGVGGEVKYI